MPAAALSSFFNSGYMRNLLSWLETMLARNTSNCLQILQIALNAGGGRAPATALNIYIYTYYKHIYR